MFLEKNKNKQKRGPGLANFEMVGEFQNFGGIPEANLIKPLHS